MDSPNNDFLLAVQAANPDRKFASMARRILKIGEEYGEASEAYLVCTTTSPTRKVKTFIDLREELIDIAIVALDCAATRMPGEEHLTDEEVIELVMHMQAVKLRKWANGRDLTASKVIDDV